MAVSALCSSATLILSSPRLSFSQRTPTVRASSSAFSSPPLSSISRSNAQGKAFPGDATLDTKESSLVVSFGEMLIDFVPTTNGVSLAEAPVFKKAAGGAPANVAVRIARLGGSSAFSISKVECYAKTKNTVIHRREDNQYLIMAEEDPKEKSDRERIFKHFDTNGDGKISADELGDALKALGCVSTDEVQFMMDEMDTDHDGFISYDEYLAFALANRGLMKDIAKVF